MPRKRPRAQVLDEPEEAEDDEAAAEESVWLSELEADELEQYVWHFDMLHHAPRHAAFNDAFRKLASSKSLPQGAIALDIGCGSGLLGLMLLQHQEESSGLQVIGIEQDVALAKAAQENIANASRSGQMKVCTAHSASLRQLPFTEGNKQHKRASLIVAELLDSPLLGEGVLPTLRHAAKHLLTPKYVAVPSSVAIYGVVVESSFLCNMQRVAPGGHFPPGWVLDEGCGYPHEVNLAALLQHKEAKLLTAEFQALKIDFESLPSLVGQHVSFEVECLAGGRADAVVFWWRCNMLSDIHHSQDAGEQAPACLTNEPFTEGRTAPDHWRQAACVVPRLPGTDHRLQRGERVRVYASHDDKQVWFRILGRHEASRGSASSMRAPPAHVVNKDPPVPSTMMGMLTPWRLRMLNDPVAREALRSVAQHATLDARFLRRDRGRRAISRRYLADLSEDASMATWCVGEIVSARTWTPAPFVSRKRRRLLLTAEELRRQKAVNFAAECPCIIAPSTSRQGRSLAQAIYENLRSTCPANVHLLHRIPAVRCSDSACGAASGALHLLAGIVTEPYSGSVEEREGDLHLWQYWAQLDDFRSGSHAASPPSFLWPRRFRLQAAFVACPHLWSRRQPLRGRPIHGVEVGAMDALASGAFFPWAGKAVQSGRVRFPCEMWQQDHCVIFPHGSAEGSTLCEVDVTYPLEERRFDKCRMKLPLLDPPRSSIHAIVTWVEVEVPARTAESRREGVDCSWWRWADFREQEDGSTYFGPSPSKQGVLLAQNPWQPSESEPGLTQRHRKPPMYVEVECSFKPSKGEVRLKALWDTDLPF